VTRLQHADGGWRHVEALSTNRLGDPAVGGLVLNLRDVTERAALEEQLRQAAFHDPLTGLANRSLFIDRLDQALTSLGRSGGSVAVLFIDLDDFKSVNDTRGHAAGDLLLRTVAERLSGCVRPSDTVARLGGDEFAVLLPSLTGQDQVDGVLERIQLALSEPTGIAGWDRPAAASIGLATAHRPQSADMLLRAADLDMYAAKRSRKKVSTAAAE
jgi:diguanylate cyclase (GGDEF)-like protein